MLSRVTIQNFKSIGEPGVDLELKPLTFLVGPNGGGKSSILDAITLVSQRGISQAGFFSFSKLEDLHFRHESNTLSIYIDVFSLSGDGDGFTFFHTSSTNSASVPGLPDEIASAFFQKVYPIRATRGNLEDAEFPIEATWIWGNGEHTLEILGQLPDSRYRPQRKLIRKWASRFGLSDVAATLANRNQIKGSYADDELDTPLNLSLASSGSRQVLPIIVQLFWAEPESIIMIEEPEISLHPQAQIDAMEMFAEAIKEDKQIIATTHGLFMIQAIGYAIQKGWLEPGQIAVYHVEKKKDTGTIAKRLPLNKRGYIKGWIPSFTRVERKLLNEWVKGLPEA